LYIVLYQLFMKHTYSFHLYMYIYREVGKANLNKTGTESKIVAKKNKKKL